MHLTGLHLLLTYRCTFECDHCFVFSSPEAEGVMTLAQAKDAVWQAKDLKTVTDIYLEGGEPFLYYPIMLETARYAREFGLEVGIVTNGYFATCVEDAEIWLKPFKDLGVSLSISDDVYHSGEEDYETPAQITRKAAENLGMDTGIICIEAPKGIPDDKKRGEPILGGDVRFRGRAVEKLADDSLPRKSWDSFDSCPDEDFNTIGRLHLDPFGNLYPCQGVVVGNLNNNTLAEIAASFDPNSDPVIGPIHRGGPAELVRAFDLPLRDRYLDACHLCYLCRKMLREKHPDSIAPPQLFGSNDLD